MNVKNHVFWIAAIGGLISDQISKYLVVNTIRLIAAPVWRESLNWLKTGAALTHHPMVESVPIWRGVFELTFVTNRGAAFSLFSENGEWLRWLSLFVSLCLVALACFGPRMNQWEQMGYGCILAGALGNGIDRFFFGKVVDFLYFSLINFPVFNLADVFINIGIVCLLIAAFSRPPRPNGSPKRNGNSLKTGE